MHISATKPSSVVLSQRKCFKSKCDAPEIWMLSKRYESYRVNRRTCMTWLHVTKLESQQALIAHLSTINTSVIS